MAPPRKPRGAVINVMTPLAAPVTPSPRRAVQAAVDVKKGESGAWARLPFSAATPSVAGQRSSVRPQRPSAGPQLVPPAPALSAVAVGPGHPMCPRIHGTHIERTPAAPSHRTARRGWHNILQQRTGRTAPREAARVASPTCQPPPHAPPELPGPGGSQRIVPSLQQHAGRSAHALPRAESTDTAPRGACERTQPRIGSASSLRAAADYAVRMRVRDARRKTIAVERRSARPDRQRRSERPPHLERTGSDARLHGLQPLGRLAGAPRAGRLVCEEPGRSPPHAAAACRWAK